MPKTYSEADMGSMKNYDPNLGRKPKAPKATTPRKFSVPTRQAKAAFNKIPKK